MFLTPSGRFETNTKVCLSFSAYHPELWQPAWGIRLILEALISFLPTPADGAIGALDWSSEERKRLAKKSQSFCCPKCGPILKLLPELKPKAEGEATTQTAPRFQKEIEQLQLLQQQSEKKNQKHEEKEVAQKKQESKVQSEAGSVTETSATPREEITDNLSEKEPSKTAGGLLKQQASNSARNSPPQLVNDESQAAATQENPTFTNELDDISDDENAGQEELAAALEQAGSVQQPRQAQEQQQQDGDVVEEPHAEQQQEVPAAVQHADPSFLIDPLLHIMIVLMGVICYLLIQKWQALWEELMELRSLEQSLM